MTHRKRRYPIGAEVIDGNQTDFRVWAPKARELDVVVEDGANSKRVFHALTPEADGYFSGTINIGVGTRYRLRVDANENCYPDPASRFQPDGPHGASCIVDPTKFRWNDAEWPGLILKGQILYEMHIGTFTQEGTWRAAAEQLTELARTGITVIEMMPVAEFPGRFGWGYDGVDLFAPSHLYGTPDDLRAFVDRAHSLGLGVILDVVYNHFGPDGNYLGVFSDDYLIRGKGHEWGDVINFDGPSSGPVREFFITNGRYWIEEFHFDGFRFDATHAIRDESEEYIIGAVGRAARAEDFVCFIENHDQIANTGLGERSRFQTSRGCHRAMTALLLLGPWTPLLFQGQEFGASSPFLYFADVGDESVRDATRRGRAQLLAPFLTLTEEETMRRLAAPDDPEAFARCKLDLSERDKNRELYDLHIDLLKLRTEDSRFRQQGSGGIDGAVLGPASFVLRYFSEDNNDRLLIVNFGERRVLHPASEPLLAPPAGYRWETLWKSDSPRYGGADAIVTATPEQWMLPGEAAVALRAILRPGNVERVCVV